MSEEDYKKGFADGHKCCANRIKKLEAQFDGLQNQLENAVFLLKQMVGHATAKIQFLHKDITDLALATDEAKTFLEALERSDKKESEG